MGSSFGHLFRITTFGESHGSRVGEDVLVRAAFKPTATSRKAQDSVSTSNAPATIEGKGRHDPCVLPRAVPMVEAMVALALCDHLLRQRAIA